MTWKYSIPVLNSYCFSELAPDNATVAVCIFPVEWFANVILVWVSAVVEVPVIEFVPNWFWLVNPDMLISTIFVGSLNVTIEPDVNCDAVPWSTNKINMLSKIGALPLIVVWIMLGAIVSKYLALRFAKFSDCE